MKCFLVSNSPFSSSSSENIGTRNWEKYNEEFQGTQNKFANKFILTAKVFNLKLKALINTYTCGPTELTYLLNNLCTASFQGIFFTIPTLAITSNLAVWVRTLTYTVGYHYNLINPSFESTKYMPYFTLMGEQWDVFCQDLGENLLHFNGTGLQLFDCFDPFQICPVMACLDEGVKVVSCQAPVLRYLIVLMWQPLAFAQHLLKTPLLTYNDIQRTPQRTWQEFTA